MREFITRMKELEDSVDYKKFTIDLEGHVKKK